MTADMFCFNNCNISLFFSLLYYLQELCDLAQAHQWLGLLCQHLISVGN